MRPHEFTVNLLIYQDGTLAAHGVDLRGLTLETESLAEMRDELVRVTPRLLRVNHHLGEPEIEQALIHLVPYHVDDDGQEDVQPVRSARAPGSPRFVWEDHPQLVACD